MNLRFIPRSFFTFCALLALAGQAQDAHDDAHDHAHPGPHQEVHENARDDRHEDGHGDAHGHAHHGHDHAIEVVVVQGSLNSLPGDHVHSVFGLHKSLLETPRSASSVSDELMSRFNMRDIDELIAVAPGTFTQSFFGVAGSLEIRGAPGETYFRGVRRLDNPGNYPTPIGASARVDIVRGPPSPIHGPAKIGGYLDFTPKSARIEETGQFIERAEAAVGLDFGSWDRGVMTAEIGGPARFGEQDFGYWFYVEAEDSGSYYDDSGTEQSTVQASFDLDPIPGLQLQFGFMHHDFDGAQNSGWNRLTQELIDDGTYITGRPLPLDTDGDGRISHQEFDVDGDGFSDLSPFVAGLTPGHQADLAPGDGNVCTIGETLVFDCHPELLGLAEVGTAKLKTSRVLVTSDDILANESLIVYFDAFLTTDGGWEWRNQLYFESSEHLNHSLHTFSQFHDTWVVEDKVVLFRVFDTDAATVSLQLSPSLRYTDFDHADDYTNEYFDRRDLTRPASALDKRLLAAQIDDDYTEYYVGDTLDIGFAALVDVTWESGFSLLAGLRHDTIEMESRQPVDKLLLPSSNNFCTVAADCVIERADDRVDGVSWTLSLSYVSDLGLIPYVTASKQSTIIAGQGSEITTANIAGGTAFDASELREAGLKGSLLEGALYFAVARFEQTRTDFSAQAVVTNQATETNGTEVELRWVINERLLLTLGYSNVEVVNLNTKNAGGRFTFIGADDVPGIAPGAFFGGALAGIVVRPGTGGARRAGVPEHIWSLTGTYDFGNGLAASASVIDVDAAPAGFSNSVVLPAYTLINAGLVYERGPWRVNVTAKNVTDERYFRSNFPNLFGGVIVLPELPRHYAARVEYRW